MKRFTGLSLSLSVATASLLTGTLTPTPATAAPAAPVCAVGTIERLDPAFDALIGTNAVIEKLVGGFTWAEGPVWVPQEHALIFSDVPKNTAYRWSERDGLSVYLQPSGYLGHNLKFAEPGSNGLTLDDQGRLVLCQHGERRIAVYEPGHGFQPLADHYNHYRFNSPNDLVFSSAGDLYFTDPPYGLEGKNDSPLKELLFNGVYLRRKSGEVVLLTRSMTFPNGIALSPDEKTLYVNQSDPEKPVIMAFPVKPDHTIGEGRVFFDAAPLMPGRKGLPDGLKVDYRGNLFSSGPGGILVIAPTGKLLGVLNTGVATANCGWGNDGGTLYITANDFLARVRTRTRGKGWR